MRAPLLMLVAAIVSSACSSAETAPSGPRPSAAGEQRSATAAPPVPAPASRALATRPVADPRRTEALLGDHFFDPQVIVVRVGMTVTWRNTSGSHDVTARDGSFRSPTLGESYSHTFMRAGRYAFFCSVHPGEMQGEVVVEPAN